MQNDSKDSETDHLVESLKRTKEKAEKQVNEVKNAGLIGLKKKLLFDRKCCCILHFPIYKAKIIQYEKDIQSLKKEMDDSKGVERKKKEEMEKQMVSYLVQHYINQTSLFDM